MNDWFVIRRRHVCIENNVVTKPVKQVESYCKPIYKSHMYPCHGKDGNKFCTTFRYNFPCVSILGVTTDARGLKTVHVSIGSCTKEPSGRFLRWQPRKRTNTHAARDGLGIILEPSLAINVRYWLIFKIISIELKLELIQCSWVGKGQGTWKLG